ncbi:MAG: hypothetical protein HY815_14305 [Candidatus Riflebacteria bacterium]|nr:hypothetical protein [Candidatus Riflebacteria bacterium]
MSRKGFAVSLIVGLVVAAVLALGAALVLFGPRVYRWVVKEIESERVRSQIAAGWQPPAKELSPDRWFPEKLEGYQRMSHDEKAQVPALRIDLKGIRGLYRSGKSQLAVTVYQLNSLEAEAMFNRFQKAYENESDGQKRGYALSGDTTDCARISLWTGTLRQNHCWYVRGTLMVFRTDDEDDREPFVWAYVKTVGATKPPPVKP